jgi:hypothetical protein
MASGADTIKEFLVGLGFEVDSNSEKTFNDFLTGASIAVAGIAAAIATASAGIFAFTHSVADGLDELGDLANRINSTAGAISEFGYVAQLSGSKVEIATGSLESFSKVAGDASLGLGKGKKIFDKINVSVKDANGQLKDATSLVWEVGDAIKDMERGQQSAILQRLGLDKTLIETLTTDVSHLRAEFNELYNQDDINKSAEAAGKFMDAYDRMQMVLGSIGKKIAAKFFVPLTGMMERFTKFAAETAPKIVNAIAPILDMVLRLAQAMTTLFVRVFGFVFSAVSTFLGWLDTINQAFGGWLGKIAMAIIAWKLLNATILASPLGMLLALGVAILALVDDFLVFKEGGDSLFDWSDWSPWFDAFAAGIDNLQYLLRGFFDTLFQTYGLVKALFSGDFEGAGFWGDKLMERFGNIGGFIGNSASNLLAPAASPEAIAGQTSVTQKTDINIYGVSDPKQAASMVNAGQARVNDDLVRNMKGAAK